MLQILFRILYLNIFFRKSQGSLSFFVCSCHYISLPFKYCTVACFVRLLIFIICCVTAKNRNGQLGYYCTWVILRWTQSNVILMFGCAPYKLQIQEWIFFFIVNKGSTILINVILISCLILYYDCCLHEYCYVEGWANIVNMTSSGSVIDKLTCLFSYSGTITVWF